jgi:hypothetical protein
LFAVRFCAAFFFLLFLGEEGGKKRSELSAKPLQVWYGSIKLAAITARYD